MNAKELRKLPIDDFSSLTANNVVESIDSENVESLIQKIEELENLGVFKESSGTVGNISYGAVKIDGRIIFQVASDVAIYKEDEDRNININIRLQRIENTLREIVTRNIKPNLLQVNPAILNNETIIKISRTNPKQEWILMTITDKDAQLYGLPIAEIAKLRSYTVKDALTRAWQERQTKFLIRQFFISLGITIAMFLTSFLLISIGKYLFSKKLEEQSILWNNSLIHTGHAVIWLPGIGWILQLFPYTRSAGIWFLDNAITISFTIIIFLLTSRILDVFIKISENSEQFKTIPVRVFVQIFYVLLVILFLIFIISDLLRQPLNNVLAGFGAGSAILMLIFKDSIMGFTAGIQLAANKMVALGDWIEMPKYGANGSVIEVSLYTVKVQNWDKTVTLIPTYALISDSFKNWRTMFESGGRRIKRSVYIDINSIEFCNQEMLNRFSKINFVSNYIQEKYKELTEYNKKINILDNTVFKQENWITNVGIFRAYVVAYLKAHPQISDVHTFVVRQLQPTEHGLPIEIYVYCLDTRWAKYEQIQADIFDHILSIISEFDLRVFQNVSGYDVDKLSQNSIDSL